VRLTNRFNEIICLFHGIFGSLKVENGRILADFMVVSDILKS